MFARNITGQLGNKTMSRKILSCKSVCNSVSKQPKSATIKHQSKTASPRARKRNPENNNRLFSCKCRHKSDFSRGGDWVLLTNILPAYFQFKATIVRLLRKNFKLCGNCRLVPRCIIKQFQPFIGLVTLIMPGNFFLGGITYELHCTVYHNFEHISPFLRVTKRHNSLFQDHNVSSPSCKWSTFTDYTEYTYKVAAVMHAVQFLLLPPPGNPRDKVSLCGPGNGGFCKLVPGVGGRDS